MKLQEIKSEIKGYSIAFVAISIFGAFTLVNVLSKSFSKAKKKFIGKKDAIS